MPSVDTQVVKWTVTNSTIHRARCRKVAVTSRRPATCRQKIRPPNPRTRKRKRDCEHLLSSKRKAKRRRKPHLRLENLYSTFVSFKFQGPCCWSISFVCHHWTWLDFSFLAGFLWRKSYLWTRNKLFGTLLGTTLPLECRRVFLSLSLSLFFFFFLNFYWKTWIISFYILQLLSSSPWFASSILKKTNPPCFRLEKKKLDYIWF